MNFKDMDNWRNLGEVEVHYLAESPEYLQELMLMDQSDAGRQLMENFLNPLLDVEADLWMGGGRFQEVTEHQYTRNGYRRRKLKTQLGTLNLEIPTFRDGNFKTALFEPGARKNEGILLPTMKLLAYSSLPDTVRTYAEELCQLPLPNGPLTELVYHYAHVIRDFKKRPLEQAYPYVLLDESLIYTKQKTGKDERVRLFLVIGLREDGVREVLLHKITDEDPRITRPQIFLELSARGLHGVHDIIADNSSDRQQKIVKNIAKGLAHCTWSKYNVRFTRDIIAACKEQDGAKLTDGSDGVKCDADDAKGAKAAAGEGKKLETNLKKDLEAMLGASSWKECLEHRDAIMEKYAKTAPRAM